MVNKEYLILISACSFNLPKGKPLEIICLVSIFSIHLTDVAAAFGLWLPAEDIFYPSCDLLVQQIGNGRDAQHEAVSYRHMDKDGAPPCTVKLNVIV